MCEFCCPPEGRDKKNQCDCTGCDDYDGFVGCGLCTHKFAEFCPLTAIKKKDLKPIPE